MERDLVTDEEGDALREYLVVPNDESVTCERNKGWCLPVKVYELAMNVLACHSYRTK